MKTKFLLCLLALLVLGNHLVAQRSRGTGSEQGTIVLHSTNFRSGQSLRIEGLFFETANGRELLPAIRTSLSDSKSWTETNNVKGRQVTISLEPQGGNFQLVLKAQPDSDIIKWGLEIESAPDEYYTGLMERVVDGPQVRSWEAGIQEAMGRV